MKNYLESQINMEVMAIMKSKRYGWNDYITESTIKSIFEGMAMFLGKHKSKDIPVALIIRDCNDKFHFGAFVQFQKQGEEGSDEGSWTLNYTFDENDIDQKNWKVYFFPDDQTACAAFEDVAHAKYAMFFRIKPKDDDNKVCEGSVQELVCIVLDCIFNYMRANVTIDPVLEFADYFTMTAEMNNTDVYVGIEPSATLKQFVKDDEKIEEN